MIPHISNTRKGVTPGSITCAIFPEKKQITKIIKANEITPKYFFMINHPSPLINFTKSRYICIFLLSDYLPTLNA